MVEFLLFAIAAGFLLQSKRGATFFHNATEYLGITFVFAFGAALIAILCYGIYFLLSHYWVYATTFSVIAAFSAILLTLSEKFHWKII